MLRLVQCVFLKPRLQSIRSSALILSYAASIVLTAPDLSSADSAARPNIVIVMVDDMGYGDAGCYGGTDFPTPGLDQLAAEGMRFTDFHSSGCVCSPTRAGLLTGRYQQRSGVDGVIYAAFQRNRHHGLQLPEVTFAERLREAGYATGAFGKWHLGYEAKYNPVHQGFDRYVGYVSGNVDFHSHIDGAGVFDWWHQDQKFRETGYTTHLITQHTCRFIRDCVAADRPFCVYVAHEAPHDPYQGPNDKPVRREGDSKLIYNHREAKHARRAYAEMMTEMDAGVTQILATLKKEGVDNDTFLMFFSDNGATGPGSCGPLYGMKGTLWEGGHRVPGIARWPNHIKPGTVTHQLACTIDIMPTLLDLTALPPSQKQPLDGTSLLPTLTTDRPPVSRQLFWKYGQAVCMRDDRWKLIINGGRRMKRADLPHIHWDSPNDGREKIALFDLQNDLGEQQNLALEQPDRVTAMKTAIAAWEADISRNATSQPGDGQRKRVPALAE